jgi:hypothetical protein
MFAFLGLLKDMKTHMTDLRVYVEANIIKGQEYIYKFGNTVDGMKVQEALGEGSWVPVLVSVIYSPLCRTGSDERPTE